MITWIFEKCCVGRCWSCRPSERIQCIFEVSRKFSLTPRETEVFALLAKGRNAEYIAGQLMVTPATIKSHIYHIYQKLGVNSQQRLMDLVDEGER